MTAQNAKDQIVTILLALIIAGVAAFGLLSKTHLDSMEATQQHNFEFMINKLDRVVHFMEERAAAMVQTQIKLQEELMCVEREQSAQKAKMDLLHPYNSGSKK